MGFIVPCAERFGSERFTFQVLPLHFVRQWVLCDYDSEAFVHVLVVINNVIFLFLASTIFCIWDCIDKCRTESSLKSFNWVSDLRSDTCNRNKLQNFSSCRTSGTKPLPNKVTVSYESCTHLDTPETPKDPGVISRTLEAHRTPETDTQGATVDIHAYHHDSSIQAPTPLGWCVSKKQEEQRQVFHQTIELSTD